MRAAKFYEVFCFSVIVEKTAALRAAVGRVAFGAILNEVDCASLATGHYGQFDFRAQSFIGKVMFANEFILRRLRAWQ